MLNNIIKIIKIKINIIQSTIILNEFKLNSGVKTSNN
jgi:hypothetical protein